MPPSERRTARRSSSSPTISEHDPEKACPGLDPGWKPVFGSRSCSTEKSDADPLARPIPGEQQAAEGDDHEGGRDLDGAHRYHAIAGLAAREPRRPAPRADRN